MLPKAFPQSAGSLSVVFLNKEGEHRNCKSNDIYLHMGCSTLVYFFINDYTPKLERKRGKVNQSTVKFKATLTL